MMNRSEKKRKESSAGKKGTWRPPLGPPATAKIAQLCKSGFLPFDGQGGLLSEKQADTQAYLNCYSRGKEDPKKPPPTADARTKRRYSEKIYRMRRDGGFRVRNQKPTPNFTGNIQGVVAPNTGHVAHPLLSVMSECLIKKREVLHGMVHDPIKRMDGVEEIQGGRYELFIKASGQSSAAFDKLLEDMLEDNGGSISGFTDCVSIKKSILEYSVAQAKRDPRIGLFDYVFDNFSLIISFGNGAQNMHIDLKYPLFQFSVVFTPGSPGTIVYRAKTRVDSVSDLEGGWSGMTPSLRSALQESDHIARLLLTFGDLLCPEIEQVQKLEDQHTGTLNSLPGTVIHAGPGCLKPRVIEFFSATPRGMENYDPTIQHNAVTVVTEMAITVWNRVGVVDQKMLLDRIAEVVISATQRGHKDIGTMLDGVFGTLVKNLHTAHKPAADRERRVGKILRQFLEANFKLYRYPVEENEEILDKDMGPCVSVEGLCVWDDGWAPIRLYRNAGGRVTLLFTKTGEKEGDSSYRLLQEGSRPSLFDGKNGKVVYWDKDDGAQKEIAFSMKSAPQCVT